MLIHPILLGVAMTKFQAIQLLDLSDTLLLRLIAKLSDIVTVLDKILADINEVYAGGAVEGYTDESLGNYEANLFSE